MALYAIIRDRYVTVRVWRAMCILRTLFATTNHHYDRVIILVERRKRLVI